MGGTSSPSGSFGFARSESCIRGAATASIAWAPKRTQRVIFTDFSMFKVVQKRIFEVSMITKSAIFAFFEEEILFQSVAEVVKIVKN